MKKVLISFTICSFLYIVSITCLFAEGGGWEDLTGGIDKELKTIAADPQDPQVVYVGSTKAIFKTVDGGENWQKVMSIRGTEKAVNFLSIDPRNSRVIYAATENGLLRSKDEGRNWERVFEGIGELEKNCSSVAVSSRGIYLGTKAGLFQSSDEGKTWIKASGQLGDVAIVTIIVHPLKANIIYALTIKGVYKTNDAGKTWERIYISSPQDIEDGDEQETDSEGVDNQTSTLRYLAIDSRQPDRLFLSFSEGLLMSPDEGKSWQKFPDVGLLNTDVQFILLSPQNSQLYAATKGGVFRFSKDKWQELFSGITSREIRFLASDSQHNLWAATENGVFKFKTQDNQIIKKKIAQDSKEILDYFKDEPTIQEIQQVAIRYAEVQPEKIESWRRQARLKAILPELSVDYDKTVSLSTGATYVTAGTGPLDWGVSLKWDLADFIFSTDQTSIDVRSRLMVQLRDDILDEVTRLYFERRRLQTEMFQSPPPETKTKWEKELRLQELTASIDALTGGYLSRNLSVSKRD